MMRSIVTPLERRGYWLLKSLFTLVTGDMHAFPWTYNMSHDKWDVRFLRLAEHISEWSRDPSTKVGAVIVRDNLVVGIGYNGFPRGVADLEERYNDRPTKYAMVVHAEANAILMAADKAKGARLYVFPTFVMPPICSECCKLVIQSGIKEVVGYAPDANDERAKRWAESIAISQTMCREAGVTWREVTI